MTTTSPSSILPCELHVEIFRLVRDSLDNEPSPLVWLAILGVCKQWRRIALEASELWTSLRTVDPDLLKLFLDCSRSRPLNFRYVLKTVEDRKMLTKALSNILSPHFRRLQKFCVEVPRDTRFDSIELGIQWRRSLHHLTHLEICNKERRCRESISTLFNSSVLSALETLILQLSCIKQIKMLRAPRLRSLTVTGNLSVHGPQALTVDEWLEILTFTPRLELLGLEDAVIDPVDMPGQRDKVLLKRLRTIRLNSEDTIGLSANLELLTRIQLAPPAQRSYTSMNKAFQAPMRIRLEDAQQQQRFRVTLWDEDTQVDICPLYGEHASVFYKRYTDFVPLHNMIPQHNTSPHILDAHIVYDGGDEETSFSEVIDLLISNFDLSSVSSFELISFPDEETLDQEPNIAGFARLFERMSNLAHLTVASSRLVSECVKELLEDSGGFSNDMGGLASNQTYYPRFFPLLESLSICSWKDVFTGDLQPALEVLAERARHGYRLCELHVCCEKDDVVDRWLDVHRRQLNEVVGETRTCRSPRQEEVEFIKL